MVTTMSFFTAKKQRIIAHLIPTAWQRIGEVDPLEIPL